MHITAAGIRTAKLIDEASQSDGLVPRDRCASSVLHSYCAQGCDFMKALTWSYAVTPCQDNPTISHVAQVQRSNLSLILVVISILTSISLFRSGAWLTKITTLSSDKGNAEHPMSETSDLPTTPLSACSSMRKGTSKSNYTTTKIILSQTRAPYSVDDPPNPAAMSGKSGRRRDIKGVFRCSYIITSYAHLRPSIHIILISSILDLLQIPRSFSKTSPPIHSSFVHITLSIDTHSSI